MDRSVRGLTALCVAFVFTACVEDGLRKTKKNEETAPVSETPKEPEPEPEDTRCKYDIKGLALGTPCNRDKDCESNLCAWVKTPVGTVYAMCATPCNTGAQTCPGDYTCKNDYKNRLACSPDTLPEYTKCKDDAECGKSSKCIKSEAGFTCVNEDADGNPVPCDKAERAEKLAEFLADKDGQCGKGLANRSPCNMNADCAGGTCVFTLGGNVGYCSSKCETDKDCGGGCMTCQEESTRDSCSKVCKPQGGKKIGEYCTGGDDEFECESGGFCFNNKCSIAYCDLGAAKKMDETIACESTLDCPAYDNSCHNGQCDYECTDNSECEMQSGYACDPTSKRCVNQFQCKAPSCPGDSKCGEFQVQGFFGPSDVTACFPKDMFGTVNNGDACKFDFQCKDPAKCTYVDAGATKKQLCAVDCSSDPAVCGAGTECVDMGGGAMTCVPTQNLGKRKDGESCSNHVQCEGRNCAQIGDEVVCATPCPGGGSCDAGTECIAYSSWDKSPYVAAIVADNTGAVIGEQSVLDSKGGNRVQLRLIVKAKKTGPHVLTIEDALEYEPLLALFGIPQQVGAYTVKIETDKASAAAPLQMATEATANNNTAPQQVLVLPSQVAGSLDPAAKDQNDIDKFTINLTAGETLNILVSGPQLEVCYDETKVGQSGISGKCMYDFECAAGLTCDLDTYKCTKHCTQAQDCGAGQACAPIQGVRRCVPASEVASVNTGDVCAPTLDYQCKGTDPVCVKYTGTPSFCSVACNPAQGAAACPGTMECVDIDTTAVTNNMCFNAGGLHKNGEGACEADFQCKSEKCSEDAFAGWFATTLCECDPSDATTCGADTTCIDVLDDEADEQNRCIGNEYLNLAKGAECVGNFQCSSGSCVEDPASAGSFFPSYICE